MDDIDLSILADLESQPHELRERLTEVDRAHLDRLLELFGVVSDEEGLQAVGRAVASHIRGRLPADDPALRQWRSTMAPDRAGATVLLHRMAGRYGHRPGTARPPTHPVTVRRTAPADGPEGRGTHAPSPGPSQWDLIRERLLSAPSFSEAQVRDTFRQDPRHPHLIRLTEKGGAVRMPSFQFQEDCTPVPLVLAINEVLRSAKDPWGAADWWLGRNLWLGTAPAQVLGTVPDDELMAAARAVGEGD